MEIISRKEFLEILSKKKNNLVQVKIEGKYKIQMIFSKFNYNLENDILEIQDLVRDSKISLYLNNINFMGLENEEVVCMLKWRRYNNKDKIKMEVW